jgi:hypothetical protein
VGLLEGLARRATPSSLASAEATEARKTGSESSKSWLLLPLRCRWRPKEEEERPCARGVCWSLSPTKIVDDEEDVNGAPKLFESATDVEVAATATAAPPVAGGLFRST